MSFNSVECVVEFLRMDQEAASIIDIRPPTNVSTDSVYTAHTFILNVLFIVA